MRRQKKYQKLLAPNSAATSSLGANPAFQLYIYFATNPSAKSTVIDMGLRKSMKSTGISVSNTNRGKTDAMEVCHTLTQYRIHFPTTELMMVTKAKAPDDLIDWKDLCKSLQPYRELLSSNNSPIVSAMAEVCFG